MSNIGIVTDSTSSMPADLVGKYGIKVVPQVLNWGEESMLDGIDITAEQFYKRLSTAEEMPTTSQATIAGFKEAFEGFLEEGKSIVSICLSDKLSGTLQSATQAKEMLPEADIHLVDSHTVAMATGFQVLAAARAAREGAGVQEVVAAAEDTRAHVGLLIMLETLEFLHRGGRIGPAARFFGTALNIKPILEVVDGEVLPVDRVRTRSKATDRLLELLDERSGGKKPLRITIHHTGAEREAEELGQRIRDEFEVEEYYQTIITPVVGTHVGPGAFGVSFCAGV
ncbi:MAG: DegV family protein [Anaerolineales bacterium]